MNYGSNFIFPSYSDLCEFTPLFLNITYLWQTLQVVHLMFIFSLHHLNPDVDENVSKSR